MVTSSDFLGEVRNCLAIVPYNGMPLLLTNGTTVLRRLPGAGGAGGLLCLLLHCV